MGNTFPERRMAEAPIQDADGWWVSAKESSGDWGSIDHREAGEGLFLDGAVGHAAVIGVAVDGKMQRLTEDGLELTR